MLRMTLRTFRRPRAILILVGACGVASFGQSAPASPAAPGAQDAPTVAALPTKNDYSKAETWLCRPGRQDACAVDLTTTVVSADGKLTTEAWAADPNAAIAVSYTHLTLPTKRIV